MSKDVTRTLDDVSAKIVASVDRDYENGPCDGAEACRSAQEFSDYWFDGSVSDEVKEAARAHDLDESDLRDAVEAGLLRLYNPDRHGDGSEGGELTD